MISRFALVAAAGMLLGGAMTSAKAADLGGGCCADLEERVAELEATTARKGNNVVSLQVYGQVNKALLIWDDGIDSDAYVVDSTAASSRFGVYGLANISPGWTAGYNIEVQLNGARADHVNNWYNRHEGNDDGSDGLSLRKNYWYINSERFGRISVGHQATASNGTSEVVLGNSLRSADPDTGAAMSVRTSEGEDVGYLNSTVLQHMGWADYALYGAQWAEDLTANKLEDVIRYDSPSIYGFILSASWGDNDYADVALRFKKEFNDFRVAAAISYQWDDRAPGFPINPLDVSYEALAGSGSIMHIPTGLYTAFAAGKRDFKHSAHEDPSFWYLQAGIERKFLPFGSTTIYGEYGSYNSFFGSTLLPFFDNESEATRVGFGVNQKIDAAAMDIYAQATIWSFEDNMSKEGGVSYEDLTTVLIGTRIRF